MDPSKVAVERGERSNMTIPSIDAQFGLADAVVEGTVRSVRVGVDYGRPAGGQATIQLPRLVTIDIRETLYERAAGSVGASLVVMNGWWYGGRPQINDDGFWAAADDHVIVAVSRAPADGSYAGLWSTWSSMFFVVGGDGELLRQPGATPVYPFTRDLLAGGAAALRSAARTYRSPA